MNLFSFSFTFSALNQKVLYLQRAHISHFNPVSKGFLLGCEPFLYHKQDQCNGHLKNVGIF